MYNIYYFVIVIIMTVNVRNSTFLHFDVFCSSAEIQKKKLINLDQTFWCPDRYCLALYIYIIFFYNVLNSVSRFSYCFFKWNISLIILVPKSNKWLDISLSYRLISLSLYGKLCETPVLKLFSLLIN